MTLSIGDHHLSSISFGPIGHGCYPACGACRSTGPSSTTLLTNISEARIECLPTKHAFEQGKEWFTGVLFCRKCGITRKLKLEGAE